MNSKLNRKSLSWRAILGAGSAIFAAGILATQVFAAAAYHGTWAERPSWGNHWWFNNNPSSGKLTWEVHNWWGDASSLNNAWGTYQLEQEAYNPGGSSSCDKFNATSLTNVNLPISSYQFGNGCGSASWQEEAKIYLNKTAVASSTWYLYYIRYDKNGNCPGSGEVNYSMGSGWSDNWLGKIPFDGCANKTGSDPSGLVN